MEHRAFDVAAIDTTGTGSRAVAATQHVGPHGVSEAVRRGRGHQGVDHPPSGAHHLILLLPGQAPVAAAGDLDLLLALWWGTTLAIHLSVGVGAEGRC